MPNTIPENYREVLFFPEALKDEFLYADLARPWVSRACENLNVDRGIFNHNPDGSTIQRSFGSYKENGAGYGAIPSVCMDGGKGFIRFYGFGETGRDLVLSEAGKITKALSEFHGRTPCRVEIREGVCNATPSKNSQPVPYFIKNLALTKNRDNLPKQDGQITLDECIPLIQQAIFRGIIGQAMTLDEEQGTMIETNIPTLEMLDIQVFGGKPTFHRVNEKASAWALVISRLQFTMNLKLDGPWFAGKLRSKGLGLIRPYRG